MFFEQIEKFWFFKSSTGQGLAPQVLRIQMAYARCPLTTKNLT